MMIVNDKDVQVDHLGLHMFTMITWVSATPGSRLSISSNTSLLKLTNTGGDCNIIEIMNINISPEKNRILCFGK